MNDLFNDRQQETAGMTRPVVPVKPQQAAVPEPAQETPRRRRRTERFAGMIDENDMTMAAEAPQAAPAADIQPEQSVPAAPPARIKLPDVPHAAERPVEPVHPAQPSDGVPAADAPEMTINLPGRASRPMNQMPSQGVPRPAALNGGHVRRDLNEQETREHPLVRRPVNAEGYMPLQQLGTQSSRVRRPEAPAIRQEMPRQMDDFDTEYTAYEDIQEDEDEEASSGRGLIAVIIALLVLAAVIVGLIMIPEDDPGVLGTVKRAVTEPIRNLLDGDKDADNTVPARADSFTATISQATAPYKVVFHMVTTNGVTAVRVVDRFGNVLPTVTTLSAPNSESTIVWMLEMTRSDNFDGKVLAQIKSGESWNDTGLSQRLSLGSAVPVVSDVPVSQPTEPAVTTPTAVPDEMPAVLPEETEYIPEITPAPVMEAATPMATATPTMSVTATPTVPAMTTPTMRPAVTMEPAATEVPTAEPSEEPALEADAEPAEETTPEPTATPAATPRLEAVADEKADPSLISVTEIYKDSRKADEYEREKPMNMPASDEYLTRAFGVTTYRGNAFRQNAAVETVENPTSLALAWTVEAGSVAGSSRSYHGIGWTGQPVIAKWPSDVRKSMTLDQARKDQKNMKEVIVAGLDGKIYFLDLMDGSATREAIDFGYPMKSTPSLHPLSYPMMTSGQYARKMKSGTSSSIGLYYYNLMNQKKLRMIDGLDRKLKRPYSENASGAFDTSALIDRNTNTLIAIGTNGLLYTEKLSMSMMLDAETGLLKYEFEEPTEIVTMMSHTKGQKAGNVAVESSLAMYGSYAYFADMGGVLRCVDTTTMTTAWAVETGDSVRAAIALDLEEGVDSSTLWLYTANVVNNRTRGNVTIRRYNAMTGAEDWAFAIHCADGKKKDVTFNAIVTPGAMASPVIGQNDLGNLVYFTLSSISATGAQALESSSAMPGAVIALNKATGEVVWHKALEAYCYSSPVAVYDETGRGWIIQACSNGTIYLMDGLTGEVINTLAVSGVIEGSPAVYGDMMVIGTTGKNTSYIYGIQIK